MRAREHVVDLFFVSVFFTLNTQGLIAALTKADVFGFYTVEAFTNTPMPFLFAMLMNLQLSIVASVIFSLLWSRRPPALTRRKAHCPRAAWITLPPLLFVWANVVLFTNLGAWTYFLTIFVLFGAFTVIIALDESETALRETPVVLKALLVAIAALTAFGFVATLVGYIDPGMALTSADFRIIPLREISAEQLGYTPDEGVMLLGLGILWKSLATFVYLAVVVGGHLALAIRRANSSGDTSAPPAVTLARRSAAPSLNNARAPSIILSQDRARLQPKARCSYDYASESAAGGPCAGGGCGNSISQAGSHARDPQVHGGRVLPHGRWPASSNTTSGWNS